MSEANTGETKPNENMISLDEHQQKVEAAIKARLTKSEQEKQQLAQENAQAKAEAEALRTQIASMSTSPTSESATTEANTTTLTPEDVAKLIDEKTQENIEQEKRNKSLENVQSVLSKGLGEDKEFDELSRNNPDSLKPEYVYEILNALGEKGLPAIKKALKDGSANTEMHGFTEPGKLVAWASQFANAKPESKDDYKSLPNIDNGSSVSEDDELNELIKNSRA